MYFPACGSRHYALIWSNDLQLFIQFKLAHIGFTLNIYLHGTNMAYL